MKIHKLLSNTKQFKEYTNMHFTPNEIKEGLQINWTIALDEHINAVAEDGRLRKMEIMTKDRETFVIAIM